MTEIVKKQTKKFQDSLIKLKEVLSRNLKDDDIILDAAIQRFEFTFENSWKTIKLWLKQKGIDALSPKDCIKEAFKMGLITDEAAYLSLLECRNLTSHTYNLKTAMEVYETIKANTNVFEDLLVKIQE